MTPIPLPLYLKDTEMWARPMQGRAAWPTVPIVWLVLWITTKPHDPLCDLAVWAYNTARSNNLLV